MRIEARFGHSEVPYEHEVKTHLVVSLTGEESGDQQRPRLGIIPVLDRTGSMHGEKLRTATAALAYLCGFLDPEDALGLVTFSETAETPLEPDTNQRDRYMSALGEIHADGMTNLAAGLTRGVELAKHLADGWRDTRYEIRVILISDGLANVGVRSPDEIVRIVDHLPAGVRVTTIGVGRDCDHDLLARIAASGGGSYGFAEGGASIPRILGAEFGAALSIDASDIEVEVSGRDYVHLDAPLGVAATERRNGWKVHIPTLLAGEVRHLVFPAKTTAQQRRHARRVSAAVVRITDIDGRGGSERADDTENGVLVELRPKLFFGGRLDTTPPSLVEAIDRAIAAEALAQAEQYARSGHYHQAMAVLADASNTVATAGVAASVRSASAYYVSAHSYSHASAERSSLTSAMSANSRLLGSSDAFDAIWTQTMGISYQTAGMRGVAADADAAVGGASGGSETVRSKPFADLPMTPFIGVRIGSETVRSKPFADSGSGPDGHYTGETAWELGEPDDTSVSWPSRTTSEAVEGGEEE